ncbi:hypothetical protein MJO29_000769 [Puccinia striiformis f. sp. tritici]|uniref:Uncharacterized protein n=1 Tax=Puccinia striiformis f. sp. tritici PST-78 TaxID=1165861 RepID=A0A0L0VFR6_9BASI|nr:uncharacterized protein Pst134EA_032463 [Puccinia striiformis f. sp. tritici]KAH9444236.1 hypothetical protein Pst134EA_032463 [Puccinia striiformis f. sp. tritici]KAH9466953.1 hypothetical protein Pst134EB_001993 [Puccinia striiformis f. sp. tritici]KAI7967492.1 hypothetical protein MJO29_000769 [Puccinia striiformis f. sp. tritici]KNE98137.1 hypothetical protein PSTG_08601 [Puccinia striiformis f. sp. tritici PST-78]
MTTRPVSRNRLHVLYTTPILLSIVCIILIVVSLCGLVPWKQPSGTIMVIHRTSSDAQDNQTASFHFGLLGSCFQSAPGHMLHCTPAAFPPDYNTTMLLGGKEINTEHLDISMPDLPPVFFTWLLISIVALLCHIVGCLPIYAPEKLSQHRFRSQKLFSAALWILGIGWTLGFSAVLSLACFVEGFGEDYNLTSADFVYNTASAGNIFAPLTIAMVVQVLIGLTIIVQISNAPNKDSAEFSSSWSEHLRVTGP